MISAGKISEVEYGNWLTPSQALDLIGPTVPTTVKQDDIASRLEDGLIRAAAETLVVGGTAHQFVVLARTIWDDWSTGTDFQFWILGTFRGFTSGQRGVSFNAYGVRFEPVGVERMAPTSRIETQLSQSVASLDPPKSDPKSLRKPKVGLSELRSWAEAFGGANPGAPFRTFLNSARSAFPNSAVSEQRVKDEISKLGMTKSRGNPSIRRK
ncbi:hypothetical protein E1H18_3902 [Caulobacter sp. RHG1]|nr:hypothetical protein [Caulobacter sp. RHG1]